MIPGGAFVFFPSTGWILGVMDSEWNPVMG